MRKYPNEWIGLVVYQASQDQYIIIKICLNLYQVQLCLILFDYISIELSLNELQSSQTQMIQLE